MEQEFANTREGHEEGREEERVAQSVVIIEENVMEEKMFEQHETTTRHPLDIKIKRIYAPADLADGKRVLVDRLWPRGISKEAAHLDEWNREVAPSSELRKWFCHKPELFDEFRARYTAELQNDPAHRQEMERLLSLAAEGRLTLLYAAKDLECNHAIVLQQALLEAVKQR